MKQIVGATEPNGQRNEDFIFSEETGDLKIVVVGDFAKVDYPDVDFAERYLKDCLQELNLQIVNPESLIVQMATQLNNYLIGMGEAMGYPFQCCAVFAALRGSHLYYLPIGDCRLSVYRQRQMTLLNGSLWKDSQNKSPLAVIINEKMQVERGEEKDPNPVLGVSEIYSLSDRIKVYDLEADDIVCLYSDGVDKFVSPVKLIELVQITSNAPQMLADAVIKEVNSQRGDDDRSFLAVFGPHVSKSSANAAEAVKNLLLEKQTNLETGILQISENIGNIKEFLQKIPFQKISQQLGNSHDFITSAEQQIAQLSESLNSDQPSGALAIIRGENKRIYDLLKETKKFSENNEETETEKNTQQNKEIFVKLGQNFEKLAKTLEQVEGSLKAVTDKNQKSFEVSEAEKTEVSGENINLLDLLKRLDGKVGELSKVKFPTKEDIEHSIARALGKPFSEERDGDETDSKNSFDTKKLSMSEIIMNQSPQDSQSEEVSAESTGIPILRPSEDFIEPESKPPEDWSGNKKTETSAESQTSVQAKTSAEEQTSAESQTTKTVIPTYLPELNLQNGRFREGVIIQDSTGVKLIDEEDVELIDEKDADSINEEDKDIKQFCTPEKAPPGWLRSYYLFFIYCEENNNNLEITEKYILQDFNDLQLAPQKLISLRNRHIELLNKLDKKEHRKRLEIDLARKFFSSLSKGIPVDNNEKWFYRVWSWFRESKKRQIWGISIFVLILVAIFAGVAWVTSGNSIKQTFIWNLSGAKTEATNSAAISAGLSNWTVIIAGDGRTIRFVENLIQNGVSNPSGGPASSGYRLRFGEENKGSELKELNAPSVEELRQTLMANFSAFVISHGDKTDIEADREFVNVRLNDLNVSGNEDVCKKILNNYGFQNVPIEGLKSLNPELQCANLREGDILLVNKDWKNPTSQAPKVRGQQPRRRR